MSVWANLVVEGEVGRWVWRWCGRSTNPHLFSHFRSAARDEPVGARWVLLTRALPGGVQALRFDRILHEAIATSGDPRRLCDLFGLSIQPASRYTDAISEPAAPTPRRPTSAAGTR